MCISVHQSNNYWTFHSTKAPVPLCQYEHKPSWFDIWHLLLHDDEYDEGAITESTLFIVVLICLQVLSGIDSRKNNTSWLQPESCTEIAGWAWNPAQNWWNWAYLVGCRQEYEMWVLQYYLDHLTYTKGHDKRAAATYSMVSQNKLCWNTCAVCRGCYLFMHDTHHILEECPQRLWRIDMLNQWNTFRSPVMAGGYFELMRCSIVNNQEDFQCYRW
jgi:hypothetical protein